MDYGINIFKENLIDILFLGPKIQKYVEDYNSLFDIPLEK